ncbi:hypothetical protein AB0I81_59995 [Nonomuraea sp. NPDC050404]|uniref:nSTAND1 domain-containing NTPase n=1 Tax=Nonomuraea sp. NPDC050404 TaxID=3155783 RepID=UPI003410C0AF
MHRRAAGRGHDDDNRRIVLALRADFFSHCAEHPELAATVRDSTVRLSPMTEAELREASGSSGRIWWVGCRRRAGPGWW